MSKLLLVSSDRIGSSMAGPGIRYFNLARELATRHEVTLVAPGEVDIPVPGVDVVRSHDLGRGRFRRFASRYDAVLAQQLRSFTMTGLARADTKVVYDLYVPFVSENLPLFAPEAARGGSAQRGYAISTGIQRVALASGDAFVCAGERQRDLWLGALAAFDRIGLEAYREDPTLRSVVEVVPFGLPDEPPRHTEQVVKGVVPGISESDRLLIWAGGLWNWFDPLTLIRAIGALARTRSDVKLYFLGLRHPTPTTPHMEMTARAVSLADELGLTGRHVFFNFGWVPYEQRQNYLLEADIGVTAHFDDVETRFAFRTRVLDHFWAGLPTVSTEGDELGDLIAREGLGRTVPPLDVDEWTVAIEALVDGDEHEQARARIERVRSGFTWSSCGERLERILVGPSTPLRPPRSEPLRGVQLSARIAHSILRQRGPANVVREGITSLRSPNVP